MDEKLLQVIPGTSGHMIGKAIDLNDGTDQPSVRDLHVSYSKSRLLSGKGNGSDLTAVGGTNGCLGCVNLGDRRAVTRRVMAQCHRSSHLFLLIFRFASRSPTTVHTVGARGQDASKKR